MAGLHWLQQLVSPNVPVKNVQIIFAYQRSLSNMTCAEVSSGPVHLQTIAEAMGIIIFYFQSNMNNLIYTGCHKLFMLKNLNKTSSAFFKI